MTEDPQIWSSVFYWRNYDGEPTMDRPQAKFITYTKFVDRYNAPKIVGYIQFSAPIKTDMLARINSKIYWTEQRFSNSACMRYIDKINAEEGGELTILGEHWPIKSYAPTPTPSPSLEEKNGTQATSVKKKTHSPSQKTHSYTKRNSTLEERQNSPSTNTVKPVFHSITTYLSYARKHLKLMKSKDVNYLKYFAKRCCEKIENREIAPKKTRIDRDYFVMHKALLKSAMTRLNEWSC